MADLSALLRDLGAGEARVAQTLHWAGVEGQRQSTSRCPVANYVRMFYPDAFDVVVTSTDVCVWEDRDDLPKLSARVPTPSPVRSFLAAFDRGRYTRLRERRAPVRSDELVELVAASGPAEPLVRIPAPL